MPAYKLQGKLEFQGLPISIENKAGSTRHWKDEYNGTSGQTKMKYAYGYVRGTLGTDGDAVDVYVGPDDSSTKVFVVTQMKSPEFREVDEQKVMLGFSSAAEAKKAYLEHYDNPKFFGSMKEMSIDEFKEKLSSNRGKLIKHLFANSNSASIQHSYLNGANVTPQDIYKALTSRMLTLKAPPPAKVQTGETDAVVSSSSSFEFPIARAEFVEPTDGSFGSPDFMTSCNGCGYTHKSISKCPKCEQVRNTNVSPKPIWRR